MACCCDHKPLRLNVRKPGHRCGATVPFLGTLSQTVSFLDGCNCCQTFMGSPISYECATITPEDKTITANHCLDTDTTFYIHCPLIANLAKTNCKPAINVISKQLDIVSGLPGACVLHVGKGLSSGASSKKGTIENVAQNINAIQASGHLPASHHQRIPFHLLLEVAAGQGTELGKTWEEIRHLYEALDSTRVGLCIDTQHAFASGMCSFQTHEDVVKLWDMVSSIAPKGISMVHLNDSTKAFGSRVDRHAPLRQGHIWHNSDEGLHSLIKIASECGLDLVSETKDPFGDIALIKSYKNKSL